MFWLERTGKVMWEALLGLQRVTLVVLGLLLTVFVVSTVVFRYFLEIPLLWVEELCIYLIFWFYIFGAAYAAYKRSFIKGGVVEVLFKNPRVQSYFQVGATSICLGISCVFVVWGYENFIWNLRMNPITMMLFLPEAYAHLSLLVGFTLMSLYFLAELIDSVRGVL